MKFYETKGYKRFTYHEAEGLVIETKDYKTDEEKAFGQREIYTLISGEKFLDDVDSGCIIDYDGEIVNIFIDGYESNLGLCHNGLCSCGFLVDKKKFLGICKNHAVQVNWANK